MANQVRDKAVCALLIWRDIRHSIPRAVLQRWATNGRVVKQFWDFVAVFSVSVVVVVVRVYNLLENRTAGPGVR